MKHVLTAQISPERFFLVGRIHRAQVIQTDSSPLYCVQVEIGSKHSKLLHCILLLDSQ